MSIAVPTPESLALQESEKQLKADTKLSVVVDQLSEKRKRLLIATLAFPDKSDRELLAIAGIRTNQKNIFKSLDGKLGEVLKEYGVTQADIARKIHGCLNATKVTFKKTPIMTDGKITGYDNEEIHVPDWSIRKAALEMVCKLGDYFPAKKIKAEIEETRTLRITREAEVLLTHREQIQVGGSFEVLDESVTTN